MRLRKALRIAEEEGDIVKNYAVITDPLGNLITMFRVSREGNMAIISVRAEGEHGELHREAPNMYVLEEVFGKALKEENLFWIPQIDPYGDTVLNRVQLSGFLDEWHRLFDYATSEEQRQALLAVQRLAEFCLERPHRYLRFFGD